MNLWEISDGALRLHLHEGQTFAWDSPTRFVVVLAGTQGGKTSFGPFFLHREIYGGNIGSGTMPGRGGGDYIAATASFDLFKLKMLPALRECFETIFDMGRYWAGDRIIELRDPETGKFWAKRSDDRMWGRIILRSAAAGGGLESTTSKGAWLDEAGQDEFTLETWEAVLRRLSLSEGRTLITTTLYNVGWLKTELYDRWRDGDKSIDVIQFSSLINPDFPINEFRRAQTNMQEHRFSMFYRGQFSKPPGLIYSCFDDERHLCDPFKIPNSWQRYVGVDFGGVNTALVWIAEHPRTSELFLFRESLTGDKTTAEHASDYKQFSQRETVFGVWGGSPSETQQRRDWKKEGVPVKEPPIADVESGIDRGISLFSTNRLKVFRTCKGIRDELGTYRRKLDNQGLPTETIQDKRTFHRLDAYRYVACGIRHLEQTGGFDDNRLTTHRG